MAPPLPPITISKIEKFFPYRHHKTRLDPSRPRALLPFHQSPSPINLLLLLLLLLYHSAPTPSKQNKKNGGLSETER